MGDAFRVELHIAGMTCASCVSKVEKVIAAVPGVHDVTVNLLTESAALALDPALAAPADICAKLSRMGYPTQEKAAANSDAPIGMYAASAQMQDGTRLATRVEEILRGEFGPERECTVMPLERLDVKRRRALEESAARGSSEGPRLRALVELTCAGGAQGARHAVDLLFSHGIAAGLLAQQTSPEDERLQVKYHRLLRNVMLSISFGLPCFMFAMVLPMISATRGFVHARALGKISLGEDFRRDWGAVDGMRRRNHRYRCRNGNGCERGNSDAIATGFLARTPDAFASRRFEGIPDDWHDY